VQAFGRELLATACYWHSLAFASDSVVLATSLCSISCYEMRRLLLILASSSCLLLASVGSSRF